MSTATEQRRRKKKKYFYFFIHSCVCVFWWEKFMGITHSLMLMRCDVMMMMEDRSWYLNERKRKWEDDLVWGNNDSKRSLLFLIYFVSFAAMPFYHSLIASTLNSSLSSTKFSFHGYSFIWLKNDILMQNNFFLWLSIDFSY
jgi:hypothetical protein